ncbi:MAG: fibronectin type III domain-containing protein [Geobacteraceae bacterium]|nr:fibronectin type III domain-containing protein [Geobacteraceae bacterium]
MQLRFPCNLLALLLIIFVTSSAYASATREWTEKSLGESGAGSYEGVMYSDRGRLAPGMRTEKKLYKEDLSFWTGTYEKAGTLLAGGGSPPFIARLNKEGVYVPLVIGGLAKDGRDATSSVTVLRSISGNREVAGFSGSGVVVIKRSDKPDEFAQLCKLPVRGVWDLVEGDGFLYAATGPLGQIFRINLTSGTFEVWAQLKDTNVRSLCWSKGKLLAGGGDSGNLYEIRVKGRVDTLHHFDEESIQRIVAHKDGLVVAVNKLRVPSDEKAEDSYKKYFKKLTDLPAGFGIDEKMPAPPDQMRSAASNYASGAVYLIGKEYRIDRLATLKNEHVLDARVDGEGRIYLSTGPSGRVYMVRANPDERELWTVQELEYVNATAVIMRDGSPRAFLAAGHEAVAFVRDEKQGRSGSFKTKPYNASRPARWGALSWRGSGVKVFSRNGHSPKPDGSWSKWVERKNGVASEEGGKAWSFAQIRIDMTGKAEFYGFSWRYAEKNQRPEIKSLTVGERELSKGGAVRQISWEATDPNGDKLEYRLAVREEMSTLWQEVGGQTPITEAKFTIPTGQLPDGRYHLRLTASDTPSNYETPLTSSRLSPLFIVNNGRPEIRNMVFDQASGRLTATVVDKLSIISELSVAVDGGDWRSISPADGILDEKEESVKLTLPGLTTGKHSISLKAVNESGGETVMQLSISLDKTPTTAATAEQLIVDDEAADEPVAKPLAEAGAVQ